MPLLGMLVFSSVFALPFFVLATVPRISAHIAAIWRMAQLGQSGDGLSRVSPAAAVKFLSNIDLVWGVGMRAATVRFMVSRSRGKWF